MCSKPRAKTASTITGNCACRATEPPPDPSTLHLPGPIRVKSERCSTRSWEVGWWAREKERLLQKLLLLIKYNIGLPPDFHGKLILQDLGVGPYCTTNSQGEELIFARPTCLGNDHLIWPTVYKIKFDREQLWLHSFKHNFINILSKHNQLRVAHPTVSWLRLG